LARDLKGETEKTQTIIQEITLKEENRFFKFRILPGEEEANLKYVGIFVALVILILLIR